MKSKYPGLNRKPFKIIFEENCFKKGDLIRGPKLEIISEVVKLVTDTWWRKAGRWLGFKWKIFEKPISYTYKVKLI